MLSKVRREDIFAKLLGELGYSPFPHQLITYDAIASGYNTVLSAPTGSGKTEAAILPILSELIMAPEKYRPVTVLYITPLRALINDLMRRLKRMFETYGFLVARKHGDVSLKERKERMRHTPTVLITTPESLEIDMDMSPKFLKYLMNVRWVIIDELHEISSSKRGLQLAILLERLRRMAGDFQVIGLSATVSNPLKALIPFLGSSSRGTKAISAGGKKYSIKVMKTDDLIRALDELVSDGSKTLVFVNSRRLAERLLEGLSNDSSSKAAVHHSSISGEVKEGVESLFRKGDIKVVIATKTLELGIDVGDINKVIHVGSPTSVYSLLQRAGRAKHKVEEVSEAVILVDAESDYYLSLAAKKLIEEGTIEESPEMSCYLDVVSREILGHCLKRQAKVNELVDIITSVHPCKGRANDILKLVELLKSNGLLKEVSEEVVRTGRFFYQLWSKGGAGVDIRRFFSTIQNNDDKFTVKFATKEIGSLDMTYVLKYLRPWDRVRIGGRVWEVTSIDLTHKAVNVHPAGSSGTIPSWSGSLISHSTLLTKKFFWCLRECRECGICDEEVARWFRRYEVTPPSDSELLLEHNNELQVLYGPMGHRFFELLGYVLAYIGLTSGKGVVSVRVSPYGIASKNILQLLNAAKAMGLNANYLIKESIKITPQYHMKLRELLPSFGTLKHPLVKEEAIRQVIDEFNNDAENTKLLREFLEGNINLRIVNTARPSPIAVMISKAPNLRPWYGGSLHVIAESLKGMALTAEEVAEVSGLPAAYVERKLKRMRALKGRLKTIMIYDVFDGRTRWALAEDLEGLARNDLKDSFTPKYGGIYTVSLITDKLDPGKSTVISLGKDNLGKVSEDIQADELYKVVVRPLSGRKALTYYNIPKKLLPLIILNAATYLEGMGYADFI